MKFKRLIPALCMLLVSAVLMGTSTFAWFSMNREVSASNLSITAKADNPYLLISTTQGGTFTKNADKVVAAEELKLVTPTNLTGDPKFSDADSVTWGTATSTDPAQVQAENDLTAVTAADLDKYVLTDERWFKVEENTSNGTNLKLTKATFTTGTNHIATSGRVLLVSETGKYQLVKVVNGEVTATEGDAQLLETVTTNPQKVTIFFYFDGKDDAAFTENATDLSAINAAFTFNID